MKILAITAVALSVMLGLVSVGHAHRRPPPPQQDTPLECPSVKDWARCMWQEADRNGSG